MQPTNSTYPFYGPEDIKRYLSGGMNAQEMHDLEKAALKDPLLADALDGFREADPVLTNKHLNSIKASIIGLSTKDSPVIPLPSPPKTPWWRWVAAACILGLIAGSTWWFTQKTKSGIKPLASAEQPIVADSLPVIKTQSAGLSEAKPGPTQATEAQKIEALDPEIHPKNVTPPATVAVDNIRADNIPKAAIETVQAEDRPLDFQTRDDKSESKDALIASTAGIQAAPAAAMAKKAGMPAARTLMAAQPVVYLQGKVVNKQGVPLQNASVSLPGNGSTVTQNDGSFVVPAYDSSLNVLSVSRVGYQNKTVLLKPQVQNKITLDEAATAMAETVVVKAPNQRKKKIASLKDGRKAQAMATSANEVIYPEEGWSEFYEELGSNLGVDKTQTTKTLQIKFTVDDNGDPVDFEIVESPDAVLAKKAIEFIKKAKWKNFKLDKNALVKIEVN